VARRSFVTSWSIVASLSSGEATFALA